MPPTPTPEQDAAIAAFATGKDLAIEAGAGTGKTTTLAMAARTTPRTGQYLAFNRHIAMDAGRAMPGTVDCRTVHSLAYGATRQDPTGRALLDRLNGQRVNSHVMARHLGLGHLVVTIPTGGAPRQKVLQPGWQAGHVRRAIRTFCQSADPEPGPQHFAYVDGIDVQEPGKRHINNRQVARELTPALHRAWRDLCSPTGRLRYDHDVYVKQWQLRGPRIPGDFVLFDEAQDASPVMLAILAANGQQTVYVGDSQQAIYEWRGAINAMAGLGDDTQRAWLTHSWRFGPAIAERANVVLGILASPLRLTGDPALGSVVRTTSGGPAPAAVLCRSNRVAVNTVMQYQARGLSPHLVGGAADIIAFANAAMQLQGGERTSHPELACFDDWRAVQDYVAQDPQGSELALLVTLLDEYGSQIVIDALDGTVAAAAADVIVSTAHKAKGREWDSVALTGDYYGDEDGPPDDAELRLLYVAATRARLALDISRCLPLLRADRWAR
jgi:hypothetical protein